jgi:lysophospholipase L1-like esterase
LEPVGRRPKRAGLSIAVAVAVVLAAAGLTWVVLEGRSAIEALLRLSLGAPEVTDHDRWRIGSVVPALAERWWPRAGLVVSVGAGGVVLALAARRSSASAAAVLLTIAVTLASALAVELLAAPFLIVPLGLYNYYFVLDVDHRFPPSNPALGTNADGIRSAREADVFHPAGENLVFLGDSFTFGLGVSADEAFPAVTEALLRRRLERDDIAVANFGWVSSSPLLSWRLLEDIGAKYHPDRVVFALDMTDFHDDLMYGRMLERRGLYWWYDKVPITLHTLERHAAGIFERLYRLGTGGLPRQRFFATERPLAETRDRLTPVVENLERLADASRSLGADFVVLLLPRCFQYSAEESPHNREATEYTVLGPHSLEPFRFFESIQGKLSFPVVSLLPAFQETTVFPTCLPDDPHWSAAGHRVAAEAIAAFLAERIGGG